ncbi:MAG: hypothetical protein B7Y42_00365 [Polaromonas sp. 28-63-22]|jgi:hypothetical protein|nr:MAG: hypothetical protein B7Y42_00365 [Polaromonas sp. 28-63-22]
MSNDLDAIDKAAKTLRAVRDTLSLRAGALHDEMEAAKRKSMRGLRASVAAVAQAQADLLATIADSPQLFVKPKSIVLHGIKLGYAKGKGRIEWDDDEQVVKLVRKHMPEQFDVLIKTTEKPMKSAMDGLTVAELKKIGVTAEDSGDVAFAKDTTAEVDKLVKALLKGAEEEAAS